MNRRTLALSALLVGAGPGCHLVFPYSSAGDGAVEADQCAVVDEAKGCWDVRAGFTAAATPPLSAALKIFGQDATAGVQRAELLSAVDPSEGTLGETCVRTGKPYTFYEGYFIARQRADARSGTIIVRGNAKAGCDALCSGQIQVNAKRGWRITAARRCEVQVDFKKLTQPHCTVDDLGVTLTWLSSSYCELPPGCCGCNDGARVTIDLEVNR